MKLLPRREGIKDLLLVRRALQLPTDDQKYISGLLINPKDLKKISTAEREQQVLDSVPIGHRERLGKLIQ